MSLKDVAQRAGVSATTVSRVLNGNYYVSEETKQKVLEAVQTLNYRPNAIARSLRNARTHTIGILVPDISNPYFMKFVRAFEQEVQGFGYSILLTSSDDDPEKERDMLRVLETRVDAIILATSQGYLSEDVQSLVEPDVPLILIDRAVKGLDVATVIEENEQSTFELIRHLIDFGHTKIAMINSNSPISTVVSRQAGYERALREHNIEIHAEYIVRGHFDEQTGYTACKKLLDIPNKPTAIFCANTSITVGLMLALREMGLQIPNDVSVVSFGDLVLPELITPRITAVIQDPAAVGRHTSEILMNTLLNDSQSHTETVVLPTHIRLGSSVRPKI